MSKTIPKLFHEFLEVLFMNPPWTSRYIRLTRRHLSLTLSLRGLFSIRYLGLDIDDFKLLKIDQLTAWRINKCLTPFSIISFRLKIDVRL